MILPDEIISHIYYYYHQLVLKDSLNLIKLSGISIYEDLPDLICILPVIKYTKKKEKIEDMQRVSDFFKNLNIL